MSTATKITAVIITLNEEENIGVCLESVKSVVDEIVVLDSGSTDRTEAICLEHGARFVSTEWLGYSDTKNKGASMATNDYILSIDADEELSPELQKSIIAAKLEGLAGVYILDRHNFYLGKWIKNAGWHPDDKPRLYHRNHARWEGQFVHETLQIDSKQKRTKLAGALNHYSIKNIAHHKETVKKYAKLAAEKARKKGKNSSALSAASSSVFRFVKIYLLKLGFLEGSRGFNIARYSAWSRWLRHTNQK